MCCKKCRVIRFDTRQITLLDYVENCSGITRLYYPRHLLPYSYTLTVNNTLLVPSSYSKWGPLHGQRLPKERYFEDRCEIIFDTLPLVLWLCLCKESHGKEGSVVPTPIVFVWVVKTWIVKSSIQRVTYVFQYFNSVSATSNGRPLTLPSIFSSQVYGD